MCILQMRSIHPGGCLENRKWGRGESRSTGDTQARVPILTFSLPGCMVLGKRSLHHLGLSCLNDTVRVPVQPITQSWCKWKLKKGRVQLMAQADVSRCSINSFPPLSLPRRRLASDGCLHISCRDTG